MTLATGLAEDYQLARSRMHLNRICRISAGAGLFRLSWFVFIVTVLFSRWPCSVDICLADNFVLAGARLRIQTDFVQFCSNRGVNSAADLPTFQLPRGGGNLNLTEFA